MSNIWLEPLPPRAYLLPCNLSYILSPLPWHTSQLEASFSLHILFSVDLSLRVSLGIFLPFPISFFELIVLHVDGFFLFIYFLIRVNLIYHVVFHVYSKVIQLYIYMYLCIHFAQLLKNHPAMKEIWVQSLGWEDMLRWT